MHRLLGMVLALAVVSGLAQARLHYFYCEARGLSFTDPCAQGAKDHPSCPVDAFEGEHRDCCQRITMPAIPDGVHAGAPQVPPASVVARLPAVAEMHDAWTRRLSAVASQRARSRASPPLAGERCATLMVFLT